VAGRAAEQLVFGEEEVTSGTAEDLEAATKLARDMVARWGLSAALGAVVYADNEDEVFLGASVTRTHNISEETAQLIAVEVRRLIDAALAQATGILTQHRLQLDVVAAGLLKQETLSGQELRDLMAGTGDLARLLAMKEA
jgi:cell division protease FtsH